MTGVAAVAALLAPLVVCAILSLLPGPAPEHRRGADPGSRRGRGGSQQQPLAGNLAAVSAAVWFDFFLTQPYRRLTIDRQADIKTTVLLLAVGIAVTELAVWGRRQAGLASAHAAYLSGVREATVVSAGGIRLPAHPRRHANSRTYVGAGLLRFEYGAAGVGQPAKLRRDGEVEWRHEQWDVDGRGLPPDVDIELIVVSGGHLVGRYLMHAAPNSRPNFTQRLVAVTLADQVGAAIGRSL